MVQGLTRDIERDPVLETSSRNTQRASARPAVSYEKRPRRKTKADRYEPYKGTSVSKQGSLRPKHSQKKTIPMKRNNSRLAEKFRAENVKTGRLTLTLNENLGIFKKGKTSSPTSCVKVLYPNFSELQFLTKESQAAIPEEEVRTPLHSEKRGISPDAGTSNALIERELFQVLADCHELSVPYEEYVLRYPNSGFVSLEDLKDLCGEMGNMWSVRKEKHVFDHAIGEDLQSVNDATLCYTRIEDAYFSPLGKNAAKDLAQRGETFDMLLDSVEDFDDDVAWEVEVLAGLLEPGADRYELQAAGRTDYAHNMAAITSSHAYDVPRMLEEDCGGFATLRQGGYTSSSSTAQRQYDDSMITIGYNIRDYKDMDQEATVKMSASGISSQSQFTQNPTPTLFTTHIPTHAAVHNQQTSTTPRRHFWRCNKLY